ncbi:MULTISPECIES: hypothetical protein [Pseudomonas]|uniref:hypothetical protein n=1 Tax=Pseudomonas TaxID=286 RepID=UPI003523E545
MSHPFAEVQTDGDAFGGLALPEALTQGLRGADEQGFNLIDDLNTGLDSTFPANRAN